MLQMRSYNSDTSDVTFRHTFSLTYFSPKKRNKELTALAVSHGYTSIAFRNVLKFSKAPFLKLQ